MIRWLSSLLSLGLVVACGRDVRLGSASDASTDVLADGNGNPFAPGIYTLAFLDPPMQQCDGTLAGSEAAFAVITRGSLGLVDGPVTLTTPTATLLGIAGAPVTAALGQPAIEIMPNTDTPPGVWDGIVTGDFGAGPLSTSRSGGDLGANSTTAMPIQGVVFILYATLDGMGTCTVAFQITFSN